MAGFRRILTLEFTDAARQRIQQLCQRLKIEEPRDLIDRALKALEIMSDVAGKNGNEVLISAPNAPDSARLVKIRP